MFTRALRGAVGAMAGSIFSSIVSADRAKQPSGKHPLWRPASARLTFFAAAASAPSPSVEFQAVIQKHFHWSTTQYAAFLELCEAMNCADLVKSLADAPDLTESKIFTELDKIFQAYLFRNGPKNILGSTQERFHITTGEVSSTRQEKAAQALRVLGLHRERIPSSAALEGVRFVFILGSTVPNMRRRIQFAIDHVLPKLDPERTTIVLLSGQRPLIPSKKDNAGAYHSGDFTQEMSEKGGLLSKQQAEDSLKKSHMMHEGREWPTEAGAMFMLGEQLLPPEWCRVLIDADAAPGATRPDTTRTAYFAGLYLQKHCTISPDTQVCIVTDAAFPGQLFQVQLGLLQAKWPGSDAHKVFSGLGYSDKIFDDIAYVRIGASAIAELWHNLGKYKEASAEAAIESDRSGPAPD